MLGWENGHLRIDSALTTVLVSLLDIFGTIDNTFHTYFVDGSLSFNNLFLLKDYSIIILYNCNIQTIIARNRNKVVSFK